jgi:LacI family transcriptional regulator
MDIQNDRERFRRHVQMLLERRVEGFVALANSLSLETNLLAELELRGGPTVVIGRQLETNSISSVVVDNKAGARAALAHLYELGHRKIAFIRGPKMLVDSGERWRGASAFVNEVGFSIDPKLVVELKQPTTSSEQGRKATEELVCRGRSFTALMVFDDMTAFGAIRALTSAGLKVPEDCSVIGFDDVAAAAFYNPPLTTIRQPMEALGSMAVHALMDSIKATLEKKKPTPVHKQAAPSLIVRESTAVPAGTRVDPSLK